MRLIFKGKILKDEMTLDEYKITDGLTIHLVKGKSAGGAASDTGSAAATADAGAAGLNVGAGAAGGGAQPNPFAAMQGMGGFGGGQPGGFGGMPGMGGMGGAGGGMPNPQMMQ
jgi:ubiquilin